jgi:hypothetical protein
MTDPEEVPFRFGDLYDGDMLADLSGISVEVSEPVEVGRIYGPDGEVVMILEDRPSVPFGFQAP